MMPPSEEWMKAENTLNSLLNERDVARMTAMSLASVRRWRMLGTGPRYRKLHFAVRYDVRDVAAWIASRPSGGETLPEAANVAKRS
jgi:predicted DNA-binding transcriptional regulator AlpA